jgi:hypothetical protein
LLPGVLDRQRYEFPNETDRIRIRLVHRRFWRQVAAEKSWPSDQELIEERELVVPQSPENMVPALE